MLSFEKTAAVIPVLIVALAITFDVGYFWAIDINFFTLFSLSEHLVFAAEAIPVVLVTSIVSGILVLVSTWIIAGQKQASPNNRPRAKYFRLLNIFWYVYMLLVTIGLYWFNQYAFAAVNLLVLIFGVIFDFVPRSFLLHLRIYGRQALISSLFIVTFILAFATGYQSGQNYSRAFKFVEHVIHLKNQSQLQGRIIRSGERGILFIDSSGLLQFVRFENVISISRKL